MFDILIYDLEVVINFWCVCLLLSGDEFKFCEEVSVFFKLYVLLIV